MPLPLPLLSSSAAIRLFLPRPPLAAIVADGLQVGSEQSSHQHGLALLSSIISTVMDIDSTDDDDDDDDERRHTASHDEHAVSPIVASHSVPLIHSGCHWEQVGRNLHSSSIVSHRIASTLPHHTASFPPSLHLSLHPPTPLETMNKHYPCLMPQGRECARCSGICRLPTLKR